MGKACGIVLIVFGVVLLAIVGISALAFKSIVKTAIPIGVGMLPVATILQAWIDVPLPMSLTATLSNAFTTAEEGCLGVGQMDFRVTLDSREEEDNQMPALFIQEEAAIDQVQRYVLRPGPLNYPSLISWLFAPVALVIGVTGLVLRLGGKNSSPDMVETLAEKD